MALAVEKEGDFVTRKKRLYNCSMLCREGGGRVVKKAEKELPRLLHFPLNDPPRV